jgi:hypothetical protein
MKPLSFALVMLCLPALVSDVFAQELDLDYHLKIDRPETGVGYVTLTIKGLEAKGFELRRAAAAGESWFDNVRAVDGARRELTVVPVDKGFYVTTEGDSKAVVTYAIKPGQVCGEGHVGLICAEYAALDGSMLFLAPPSDLKLRSAVLSAEVPSAWQTITSWPGGQGYYRPDAALAPVRDQLEKGLICFGVFRQVSKKFGLNAVNVYTLATYPAADAEKLSSVIFRIYGRIYDVLKCDTNMPYNVVCLPPSPDEFPVVAGAWADGQALTLAGTFPAPTSLRYAQYFARFVVQGYFAEPPFGVNLADEDRWLYYGFLRYAEGLAGIVTGKMEENPFYASIYSDYATEAQSDASALDLPMAWLRTAPRAAKAFMEEVKAPVLLMRLDIEIREATGNSENVESLLAAIYGKGRNWEPGTSVSEALREVTKADFGEFYNRFVRRRDVLLPTWPSFLEKLSSEKAGDPGPVAAEVDGVPIYRREVEMMSNALLSQGTVGERTEVARTALTTLVNEKLMDKQMAAFKINVIPEAFWKLRLVLPAPTMSAIIAAKRQVLKDLLYDDWLQKAKGEASIEVKDVRPEQPVDAQPPARQR